MRDNAVYVVSLIAAVAAVLAVTTVFHNGQVAWILCGILLFGLAITIPMYFVRGDKRRVTPEANGHASPPSVPVVGPLIAAYDQAIAIGNEANISINYYSPPTGGESEAESTDE
jgi:hypothetical protein